MALSQVSINTQTVSQAYNRALLFDKLKKKQDGVDENSGEANSEKSAEQTLSDALPKEKIKPNTVPFKTGFVFEYAGNAESGPITVTITDTEKVKVDLKDDKTGEERKRAIRSVVMLGLGKLSREDFNASLVQGKNSVDNIKNELTLMGLKPDIPFGLGPQSFYINSQNLFSQYKPMDIKG